MLSLTVGADLNGRAGCFPFQFDREVVEVRSRRAAISDVDFSEGQMAPIKNNNNSLRRYSNVSCETLVTRTHQGGIMHQKGEWEDVTL